MKQLTVIDLFSGCGGLSYGLYQEGFKILAGIDKWDAALKTFQINHKDALTICTDLTQFEPQKLMKQLSLNRGDLDCLVGGPPCQGFSKNVPAAYRFLEDPRNLLFRNYLNWVKALYPKVVLMENVAPIYNAYGGAVRHEIIETLEKLGYKAKVKTLWAHDYGVPQRRQRCFFLCFQNWNLPFFSGTHFC
jgi:DNA (cytosine-5)-methyltransferase 1